MKDRVNPFTKVDTVIVRVRDLAKARKWYEEKLGFKASYTGERERIIVFNAGGETSFTIFELKPGEKVSAKTQGSYPIFYAPDISAAHKHLEEHDVRTGPIQGVHGETQWFEFWDLDKNLLEVCHY